MFSSFFWWLHIVSLCIMSWKHFFSVGDRQIWANWLRSATLGNLYSSPRAMGPPITRATAMTQNLRATSCWCIHIAVTDQSCHTWWLNGYTPLHFVVSWIHSVIDLAKLQSYIMAWCFFWRCVSQHICIYVHAYLLVQCRRDSAVSAHTDHHLTSFARLVVSTLKLEGELVCLVLWRQHPIL